MAAETASGGALCPWCRTGADPESDLHVGKDLWHELCYTEFEEEELAGANRGESAAVGTPPDTAASRRSLRAALSAVLRRRPRRPTFERTVTTTSGGAETTWQLWRIGSWHLKIVWWRSR